ncbi:hypothetical protein [Aminivibrio sp.]
MAKAGDSVKEQMVKEMAKMGISLSDAQMASFEAGSFNGRA